jgi:hypothetical protein
MSNRLLNLEQTINHKIKEAREEMHKVQDLTKRDNLWIKVETLQWVLDQMLIFEEGYKREEELKL